MSKLMKTKNLAWFFLLITAVLIGSIVISGCSSSSTNKSVTSTSTTTPAQTTQGNQIQPGQQENPMVQVAAALGIDQKTLEDALTQARSELGETVPSNPPPGVGTFNPPNGTPGSAPSGAPGQPPAGNQGQPPAGNQGQPPAGGAPTMSAALLAKVAAILGIDQQKVEDAFAQFSTGVTQNQTEVPGNSNGTAAASGTATYTQSRGTETKSNQTITASDTDKSAVMVTDGGTFTLSDSTVKTTGNSSSMDSSSFYGLNAAILAESASKIILKNSTVTTSGTGANGVFATGTGSVVELSDVTINCTASGAHGVDATIGGTLVLTNVDITTAGDGASAAIATDRGGGTITVTGGTVVTSGTKSPGVYSTGDITITGATITATGSEAAAIEGKNSITLTNTTLSGAKLWGVIIYQSMSGDAEAGTGNFTMNGGSLTAEVGPLFYTTNTDAVINLTGVNLSVASGTILTASAGDWGNQGSNGATVTLNADSQTLNGNITCDNISTITLTLQNSSILKGTINNSNTGKSVALTLDENSIWNVTGTSYLTSLTDAASTLSNIKDNGNTIYYDASASANQWLKGQTYILIDGGKLTPVTE